MTEAKEFTLKGDFDEGYANNTNPSVIRAHALYNEEFYDKKSKKFISEHRGDFDKAVGEEFLENKYDIGLKGHKKINKHKLHYNALNDTERELRRLNAVHDTNEAKRDKETKDLKDRLKKETATEKEDLIKDREAAQNEKKRYVRQTEELGESYKHDVALAKTQAEAEANANAKDKILKMRTLYDAKDNKRSADCAQELTNQETAFNNSLVDMHTRYDKAITILKQYAKVDAKLKAEALIKGFIDHIPESEFQEQDIQKEIEDILSTLEDENTLEDTVSSTEEQLYDEEVTPEETYTQQPEEDIGEAEVEIIDRPEIEPEYQQAEEEPVQGLHESELTEEGPTREEQELMDEPTPKKKKKLKLKLNLKESEK